MWAPHRGVPAVPSVIWGGFLEKPVLDTSNLYSEVPEGNWFGSVHSALALCFLGANLPGGMGPIKVNSP